MNFRQIAMLACLGTTLSVFSSCEKSKAQAVEEVKKVEKNIYAIEKVETSIVCGDDEAKHNTIDLLTDGNKDTFFWSGSSTRKGDYITLTYKNVIPKGKTIRFYTGFGATRKGEENGDIVDDGILEVRTSANDKWQKVATFHCGIAECKLPVAAKQMRFIQTLDKQYWTAFREIEISDKELIQQTVSGKATYQGKEYHLSVSTDLEQLPSMQPHFELMSKLYFEMWPKLIDWLGVPVEEAKTDIDIIFAKNIQHPAHAYGHTMVMKSTHLAMQPKDAAGVFVHELGHIIQGYKMYEPAWFVEGSADYLRYKAYPNGKWAIGWKQHTNHEKPFGQYWNSACFLLWLEDKYDARIVRKISRAIYDQKYKPELFKKLTGKDLEALGKEYSLSNYVPK